MKTLSKTKKFTKFRPMILSRHPSHDILRLKHKKIAPLPYRSVIRFGSSTEVEDTVAKGGNRIEINTVASIKISANKLLMKQKFTEAGVKTAPWRQANNIISANEEGLTFSTLEGGPTTLNFPVVGKEHFGSKGKGNTLIRNLNDYQEWRNKVNLGNCIIEQFMNYANEYRLHVTEEGCFYTCRKALKSDAPENQKWRRHDDICVWFLEDNPNFNKPNSWNDIEADCVKALKAVGADILSFDVRVQAKPNKEGYQDYLLLECNSASSMSNGTDEISVCAQKYIDIIPKVILNKVNK